MYVEEVVGEVAALVSVRGVTHQIDRLMLRRERTDLLVVVEGELEGGRLPCFTIPAL